MRFATPCALAVQKHHWKRYLLALALFPAFSAYGQTFTVFAGGLRTSGPKETTAAWGFDYQRDIGSNVAASLAWLNEGHVSGHHRDGPALQLWVRAPLLDARLSLAAGAGPYYYFDTASSSASENYENRHGLAAIGSLAATYHTRGPWLLQLRAHRIVARRNIDTNSLVFGIGYQFDHPANGPRVSDQPANRPANEITAYFGQTVLNSYNSQSDRALAIEYRRGVTRSLDVTATLVDEGDAALIARKGIAAQLWAVREFSAVGRGAGLGIGLGPYLATELERRPALSGDSPNKLAWMFSMTASYRMAGQWNARFSWNRVKTDYDRDADLVLLGVGYRF